MAKTPASKLSTNSLSVRDVLKSAYFEVPPNQREYRWENEQLSKIWGDLIATVNNDCIDNPGDPEGHFLGAVTVIGQEHSLDQDRWQIIDGQQRLTTITILAECLREYVEDISDRKLRRTLGHVLWDCVVSPGSSISCRIKLNREDDFYRNSLIENEGKESKESFWLNNFNKKSEVQKNLKNAFEFFYEKISSYVEDKHEYDDAVRDLVETLTEGFYFLVVRTDYTRIAYTLFETLNERGLDLSQADLIKNVLLEHARYSGDTTFSKVSGSWSSIIDNYEDQSSKKLELPQIVQFSYTSRHKTVKKEDIFKQISSDLRGGDRTALELVSEFKRDSELWSDFLLGDLMNWPDDLADSQYAIVEPLWKIHSAPFLMACMDKYSNQPANLERTTQLCENYLFRQGLVGKDSVSSLQDFFGEASYHIRIGKDLEFISGFFRENSPDDAFKEAFKTASVSNMKQGFYTVWKIEKHLNRSFDVRPKSQSAAQHLEHIMPKKPNNDWKNIENSDDFSTYINRIGNFLILPSNVNQHIKNKSIEYKINNQSEYNYKSCNFKLAEEFVREFRNWGGGSWDFRAIMARQEYLAEEYSLEVWPL